MSSIVIAGIVFAAAFGGALVGLLLRAILPGHHLSNDSKDTVKLGTGLIATMSALVIGLLIASAKADFDAQKSAFQQMSTNFVLLDRGLSHYGPEAKETRALLRRTVSSMLDRAWSATGSTSTGLSDPEIAANMGAIYDAIRNLKPQNDTERIVHSQALQISTELGRTRLQLSQRQQSSIPIPFLVVLDFWLAVLFASFGLFSPPNATVLVVLFVCALSVAGALFLIVDLDQPFEGLIQLSDEPLRHTLSQLGQ